MSGPFVTLPFTAQDAFAAARIRERLKHQPIGSYDLLIAGQALNGAFTVVTNNSSEFSRVPGLRSLSWSNA